MSRSADAARWLHDRPGALLREAAELHGISYQAVRKAWARLYPGEPLPLEAQRRGAADIVAELVRGGEVATLAEIAAMAGCSKSKAGAISRRVRAAARAVATLEVTPPIGKPCGESCICKPHVRERLRVPPRGEVG